MHPRVPCLSPIPPTLADSKAQVTALQLIVGSLQRCTVFGTENRAALVHKATGYSAKLLKKPDQCRAVYMCAHLFWHDTVQELCDAASVLQCLKRALKIANAAQVRNNALDAENRRHHLSQLLPTLTTAICALTSKWQALPRTRAPPACSSRYSTSVSCAALTLSHSRWLTPLFLWAFRYLFFFDKGCESITAEVLQNLLQLVADEVSRESAPPELVSFHRATLAHCRAQKAKGGDIAERYAALTV